MMPWIINLNLEQTSLYQDISHDSSTGPSFNQVKAMVLCNLLLCSYLTKKQSLSFIDILSNSYSRFESESLFDFINSRFLNLSSMCCKNLYCLRVVDYKSVTLKKLQMYKGSANHISLSNFRDLSFYP